MFLALRCNSKSFVNSALAETRDSRNELIQVTIHELAHVLHDKLPQLFQDFASATGSIISLVTRHKC